MKNKTLLILLEINKLKIFLCGKANHVKTKNRKLFNQELQQKTCFVHEKHLFVCFNSASSTQRYTYIHTLTCADQVFENHLYVFNCIVIFILK